MCRASLRQTIFWRSITLPSDAEVLLAQLESDVEQ
jgi:hypothetical protein